MHKIEKSGHEVFIITDELLNALRNIQKRCKDTHDDYSYEIIGSAITGLTKTRALEKLCREMETLLELSGTAISNAKEYIEYLFPKVKNQEESAKETKNI